jgi:transcriptional regulator with GAF, ATPase, and Fis domain
MISKLEFFREVSIRLSSSLDPNEAIPSFFRYICRHIPLEAMVFMYYDPGIDALRVFSIRTETTSHQPFKTIPLSDKSRRFYRWPFERNVVTFDRMPMELMGSNVYRYLVKQIGFEIGSALMMCLRLEKETIGVLGMFTEGGGRYDPQHADLIESIIQLIAMAAANSLKHYEEVRQKELLSEENRFLYQELKRVTGDTIIGADSGLREIMRAVGQVSQVSTPVLILGETGVGKELIADTIQQHSHRADSPYIKVNCGAISETLLDSDLFGYEKGAFTGAERSKKGRFERAASGTIFLDEIGELSPGAQVRLLRVIQNKELERVGGKSTINIDIRVMAASNRDLPAMVRDGTFREDLFFRLNVFPITVPPLRHRKQDIPALLHHFIEKYVNRMKLRTRPDLVPGAVKNLMKHDWPGNIRELENLVERALILQPAGPLNFEGFLGPSKENSIAQSMEEATILPLDELVRRHIMRVLDITNGKISGPDGAADLLAVHPNTLRNRMDKLNINYGRSRKKQEIGKGSNAKTIV